MRILFSNASLMWGGNEKWTLNAAETLAARGHDVWVAVREEKLWRERRKTEKVKWVELPFLNDADIRTIWKLRQLIQRERIEILLPTRSRDYWLAGFARMGTKAKYVMRMGITRTLPNTIKERLRYGVWPDGIIVNAQAVKDSLAAHPWVKVERIRVIYNGVDCALPLDPPLPPQRTGGEALPLDRPMPPQRTGGEAEILVLAAGRVESEKGFDVLIDAMARAVKEEPRLICEIWGQGDQVDNLNAQIARLDLAEHVRLRGFTASISHQLTRADIAVSSSYREGISNFILESWAAGVPIVATAIEGSAEIVHDRQRGLLVPPGDAAAMSKAILEMAQDRTLRDKCIQGGKSAIATTHNWTAMAEKMEALFSELLAS